MAKELATANTVGGAVGDTLAARPGFHLGAIINAAKGIYRWDRDAEDSTQQRSVWPGDNGATVIGAENNYYSDETIVYTAPTALNQEVSVRVHDIESDATAAERADASATIQHWGSIGDGNTPEGFIWVPTDEGLLQQLNLYQCSVANSGNDNLPQSNNRFNLTDPLFDRIYDPDGMISAAGITIPANGAGTYEILVQAGMAGTASNTPSVWRDRGGITTLLAQGFALNDRAGGAAPMFLTDLEGGDILEFGVVGAGFNTDNLQIIVRRSLRDVSITTALPATTTTVLPVIYPGDEGASVADRQNFYWSDEEVGAAPVATSGHEYIVMQSSVASTATDAQKEAASQTITHYVASPTSAGFVWTPTTTDEDEASEDVATPIVIPEFTQAAGEWFSSGLDDIELHMGHSGNRQLFIRWPSEARIMRVFAWYSSSPTGEIASVSDRGVLRWAGGNHDHRVWGTSGFNLYKADYTYFAVFEDKKTGETYQFSYTVVSDQSANTVRAVKYPADSRATAWPE